MRNKYYWLIAKDPDTGKIFLIAGGRHEEEARQKGLEMLAGIDFEIRALPTIDLQTASAMVRGKRLEATQSLREAKQRLGHDRSLERYKRRRSIT